MYVFVGWASLDQAMWADLNTLNPEPGVVSAGRIQVSPEYDLFEAELKSLRAQTVLTDVEPTDQESDLNSQTSEDDVITPCDFNWPDKFNSDLLAIGVTVPSEDKTLMYSLNRRLPSSSRLSVAAAFCNYLVKLHSKPGEKITLVGFNVQTLLDRVAYACAVRGLIMPAAIWRSSDIIELSTVPVTDLIEGHVQHLGNSADGRAYSELLRTWFGPMVSAQRSLDMAIALSILLGLCEAKDGTTAKT